MNLVKEYIREINEGGVPNIQNAWSYLCNQENEKVMEETLRVFKENMQQQLVNQLPLDTD